VLDSGSDVTEVVMTDQNVLMLDPVGLFRSASPEARRTLAERGRPRMFPAGEVLMRQGEQGDTMHVVLSGRVRVERTRPGETAPRLLAELGANDVVGEIGVLDGGPRTATVTALEETRTLELHRTLLAVVLIQHPDVASELLKTLSQRLRTTDEILDTLTGGGAG
jgi:CRP/FNR family transcriptional regulator, cyclic AMP receptor protein